MENSIISNQLFAGMTTEDIEGMLSCCGAWVEKYPRGSVMVEEDSAVESIGLVVAGQAQASRTDPSGRQIIISRIEPGELYGDVLAVGNNRTSPVRVVAIQDSKVLLIPYENILHRCSKLCPRHELLLRNLLYNISAKYFALHERINCIIRPSLREKILFYLESVAQKQHSRTFNIPFDRSAMADFLNTERSALSRELSALKQEGVIDFYKNSFKLL